MNQDAPDPPSPNDATPTPDNAEVATFDEVEAEVKKHFDGDWKRFMLAVQNPAEILHFVLTEKFGKDKDAFEAWSKSHDFPPDWVPRFYSTLNAEGELSIEFSASQSEASDDEANPGDEPKADDTP